jgi:hypothetical protein
MAENLDHLRADAGRPWRATETCRLGVLWCSWAGRAVSVVEAGSSPFAVSGIVVRLRADVRCGFRLRFGVSARRTIEVAGEQHRVAVLTWSSLAIGQSAAACRHTGKCGVPESQSRRRNFVEQVVVGVGFVPHDVEASAAGFVAAGARVPSAWRCSHRSWSTRTWSADTHGSCRSHRTADSTPWPARVRRPGRVGFREGRVSELPACTPAPSSRAATSQRVGTASAACQDRRLRRPPIRFRYRTHCRR